MKIHYSNSSARQLLLSQGCTRVVLALALGGLQHSCSAHQVCREVHACADLLALGNPLETISLADRQTD